MFLQHLLRSCIIVRSFIPLERTDIWRQRKRKPPLWVTSWRARNSLLWIAICSNFGFGWNSRCHIIWNRKWRAAHEAIVVFQWNVIGWISWTCSCTWQGFCWWRCPTWGTILFCSNRDSWSWWPWRGRFVIVKTEVVVLVIPWMKSRTRLVLWNRPWRG